MLEKYFDTSVLVAFYYPEKLSDLAEEELLNSFTPVISSWGMVEFYSVIAKKIRKNEMSSDVAYQITRQFQLDIKNKKYKNITLKEMHYKSAKKWLNNFDLTLYAPDALHLAISYHAGYNLITADKGLSKAAKSIGVDCKLLSK